MIKTKETKEILNEWHKFENKNRLNESQGAATRQRPQNSKRAQDLLKKLESTFGSGPFYNYSQFDNHSDDEMIADYGNGTEGIQVGYQEILDFVNSTGEIEISDMSLGDFVIADDNQFNDSGIKSSSLNIVKAGVANFPSGEYAEFGYVALNDGERIPVVYSSNHGHTIYGFIPTEYDARAKQTSSWHGKLKIGGKGR